jgi:hypothetical protein
MVVNSSAFQAERIARKYTSQGDGISPPLPIEGAPPAGTYAKE